jgi:hypothetical protein
MTGKPNTDFNKLNLECGLYAQIYKSTTFATKPLRSRTIGAIVLTSTGNAQGDHYFMSLITGHRFSQHQWTAVLMTNLFIRVEQMAAAENQPFIQASGLLVKWLPNNHFNDNEDPDYLDTPEV